MAQSYRFGNAELLPLQRRLLVDGQPAAIGARAFDVLVALIERRDRTVTKAELLDVVWPELVVEENNLAAQVSALRKVLGPAALATIPGVGYRFCVPIVGEASPGPVESPGPPGRRLTNLPAAYESLIGRDAELAAVGKMLDAHRLVTLVGPGGIGKTRLAQEVARAQLARFEAGVWWVDLAAIPTKELIIPAIAHAAELTPASGEPAEELARAIGERPMLLVLDNCEHVAGQAARVVRCLLASAPATRVLATSQELLKVPGEFAYALDGLEVADEHAQPEVARACAALQLFERRALAADARYRLPDASLAPALELCRRLDGMALAIEMAAARAPVMGIEMLLSRLGERLRILRSADRSAEARYRTIRATLEWSVSLLSPTEKSVLARLAVFVGSFRLEAARHVASPGDQGEWEVLDCISALVDKSLLRVEHLNPPRYRLLETMRLFGMELLAEHGELEEAVRAHASAMATLAAGILDRFDREGEEACVTDHAADYDDLRAAWERGRERDDPEMATGTIMALARIDRARGFYRPTWIDKSAAQSMARRARPLASARLWYCIALLKFTAGITNVDAALAHVAAWRRVGDDRYVFEALGDLAEFLAAAGRADEAEAALSEMRELDNPTWPPNVRLSYHWPATSAAAFAGDMALLKARLDDQERAARQAHSLRTIVVSSWQRIAWAVGAGDLDRARELGLVAIRMAEEFGNPGGIAAARLRYSAALLLSESRPDVTGPLRDCLQVARHGGFLGDVLEALALQAAKADKPSLSARLLGSADACYSELGELRGPLESRVAAAVAMEAARGLDGVEFARLRTLGFRSARSEALALADALLAAPSLDPVPFDT